MFVKTIEDKNAEATKLLREAENAAAKGRMSEAKALQSHAKTIRAEVKDLLEIAEAAGEVVSSPGAAAAFSAKEHAVGSDFGSWSDFVMSASKAVQRDGTPDRRLMVYDGDRGAKQMVEAVGASGGFLVPVGFYGQLQAVAAESAIVRNRATILRMSGRQVDIPVLDQTGTASGRSNFFGGAIFYYAEESEEKTETSFDFRLASLVAHKLIGYTRASDELVADSAISFDDFISGPLGFAGGIAWEEDYAFLRGTGVGQPLGIINAGCTISVPRAAGGTVTYPDLCDMLENFLPSGSGVWIMSHTLRSDLMQLQDAAGNYIWQPNARDSNPQTLLGFPIYFTEKLPGAGTTGDCVLADLRYYLIGDRQATTIESTKYDYWRYDQTSWRVVHRYDGQPFLSTYLTSADGTSTFSPFVMLSDKST